MEEEHLSKDFADHEYSSSQLYRLPNPTSLVKPIAPICRQLGTLVKIPPKKTWHMLNLLQTTGEESWYQTKSEFMSISLFWKKLGHQLQTEKSSAFHQGHHRQ